MGIFDKLFNRGNDAAKVAATNVLTYADTASGYMPISANFGSDILASDVVMQCIGCITGEVSKLRPTHLKNDMPYFKSGSLQALLEAPNPVMTTADLLAKVAYELLMTKNAYIIPAYDVWRGRDGIERRNYRSLYPIKPSTAQLKQDQTGELFITFEFNRPSYNITLPYSDVIHIRSDFGASDYFGGGMDGTPDRRALLKTLQLNSQILNNTARAASTAGSMTGIVQYHGIINKNATLEVVRDFENRLRQSNNGFLVLDDTTTYKDITKEIKYVDPETLKFIDEKICRSFGVSLPILKGDYTKAQYEAFYQQTIEPIIVKFNQAFTNCLFTQRERAFGNRIEFLSADLQFMTMQEKIELLNGPVGQSGTFYQNEIRLLLGFRPDPELEGKRMISLNYIEAADYVKNTNDKEGENNDD